MVASKIEEKFEGNVQTLPISPNPIPTINTHPMAKEA
jgi:hypothetical protein